ncbi:hypothetical protein [Streptomyces sp. NPDC014995]|uniref:hypothetical protein n=1 Tax=Streptomyces sp. NPDC014995 TaxID=3364936 RepID=UPI0037033335
MSLPTRRSALRSAIAVALAPTLGSLALPGLAPTAAAAVSWSARWIWAPSSTTNQWVAFRRSFTLGAAPSRAVTQIAADSKYWLWVNGTLVVFEGGLKRGPNRTDTYYDEIDLAPYLTSGRNTVALLVWYFGKQGFSHNSSGKGGLLFQSDVTTGSTTTRHRAVPPAPSPQPPARDEVLIGERRHPSPRDGPRTAVAPVSGSARRCVHSYTWDTDCWPQPSRRRWPGRRP